MTHLDRRTFAGLTLAALSAPPALAAAPKSDIVVPLDLERNLLTLQVTLDGQGPFPFVLATGQLFGQIDPPLADRVGLPRRPLPNVEARSVTGPVTLQLYLVEKLVLGGAWLIERTEFIGRPYAPGAGAHGLFPFTAFLPTTVDFDKPELRVHRAPIKPSGGAKVSLVQRSGPVNAPPIVRVDFGGETLKLVLDTGYATGLTLYPDAVRRLGLWDRDTPRLERTETDAEGRSYDTRLVRGDPLQFAGHTFERPVARLMSPSLARADQLSEDGVIGMDMLRRFRITFDPQRHRAWLWPNANLQADFRYDRAGAGVDDGVVDRIDPAGPAERAGLRLGDRLLRINGADEGHPEWTFSGAGGEIIALTVERDGERMDIPLVLEERL